MDNSNLDVSARRSQHPQWRLRETAPALRATYLANGWWTDQTMGQFLRESLPVLRDRAFTVYSEDQPYSGTIGEVVGMAQQLAQTLRDIGIGEGDVVAIQLPNWMPAAVAFWAAAWMGAVSVPIAHFYGPKELRYILKNSGARVLVTAVSFRRMDYLSTINALRSDLPDLESVIVVGDGGPDFLSFEDALKSKAMAEPASVSPDDPTVIAYTSGTTSNPKGVIHSHRSLLSGLRMPLDSADERAALVGTPVGHVTGMTKALLLPLLKQRAIHMIDVWNPEKVLDILLKDNLPLDGAPSYFIKSIIEASNFQPEHLEHMKYVVLGGAKIHRSLAEELDRHGCEVKRVYGSSEALTTTGAEWSEPKEKRLYTDGRPMHGTELLLVDPDGKSVEEGEAGEILIRSPRLFLGYTDPRLTERVMNTEGWYRTGDVGVIDEDGYLMITDRIQDVIIRGGENISAAEVEELLTRMPGVGDVAVVSAPDEKYGERVCAFVVPSGEAPVDLAGIQAYLAKCGLARPKWPEELHILGDDFPRTPAGKIKKFVLRASLSENSNASQ